MRILLVTSFFPPVHTAGTEMRTFAYARSLQKLGHEVQVICAGEWLKGDKYWNGTSDDVYQGVPVHRLNINWMLAPDPNRYLYSNPVVEEYFSNFLIQWKPQIMHITSCVTMSARVIQAARDHHIPVVLTLTDFWFICPRVNLLKGEDILCDGQTTALECLNCTLQGTKVHRIINSILPQKAADTILTQISQTPLLTKHPGLRGLAFDMEDRKAYLSSMLHNADFVTAPSLVLSETVNKCVGSGVDKVIHSGHDLSWLESLAPRKQSGPLRISYIGQIIPIKGVHVLLSAYISAGLHDQTELVIYGGSAKHASYLNKLKEMASAGGVNVKFSGQFPHDHLGEILSQIDVLVVPALWHENNPRIIQEAFAAKIPVIASNVGGISEFVDDEVNGLLFERGNVEHLSRQLQRIVLEPELLEQLRSNIKPVKSIDEEISEFDGIYRQLIANA